jgi:putative DNA primase/helicase
MVHSAKRKIRQLSISEFDQDPCLLNCRNGTVDLRTGDLLRHRREDLITKCIPFDYASEAKCPKFLQFLYRIMGASPDASEMALERANHLFDYLQIAFGCAATGKPEKVLVVLYGQGNNGKTTLLEAIRATLGDQEYAGEIQVESLMAKAKEAASNSINADLADLRGRRFVSSSEVEQGQRLSIARVKYITGLGQIRARYLHERFFNFKPTHKLFLDCNHRPVITDPNDAVWNRVKMVPFEVMIPPEEIDTDLPAKLYEERAGILTWIVEGAGRYFREGLQDISETRAANEEYRLESDRLAEFFEDTCQFGPAHWVRVPELWGAYSNWSNSVGESYPLAKRVFEDRLLRLGCEKKHDPSGQNRAWRGIRLLSSPDDLTQPDRNSKEGSSHGTH